MDPDYRYLSRTAEHLGPDLYNACIQNDIDKVKVLTSIPNFIDCPVALVAAASNKAIDVAGFCLLKTHKTGGPSTMDQALMYIRSDEDTDQAYKFLVESNFVHVDYLIDRTGPLLGLIAGCNRYPKRHALAKYLLESGANPNLTVDAHAHRLILTVAAKNSDPEMLDLLIQNGAKLDNTGALSAAAKGGNIDNVKYLLTQNTDVNEMIRMTFHRTFVPSRPLHLAVENGHLEVVDLLLAAGADKTARDPNGRTALDIAIEKNVDTDVQSRLSWIQLSSVER